VEQRGAQRGHQPRHPRRDHGRPAVAVDGFREVADPLREPAVVAERLPPLEPGRHHRVDRCPAGPGEPAGPAADVVGAVEHGQRLAGHGPMVDKAVRQLEAGRRHPLERLIQSWRRITHAVLLLPPMEPLRRGPGLMCRLLPRYCQRPMPQAMGRVLSRRCVTRTESHSWPPPLAARRRRRPSDEAGRSRPQLPANRLFPAPVAWAPRNLPGTGPSGHPHPQGRRGRRQRDRTGHHASEKAAYNRGPNDWPRDRAGIATGFEVDALDEDLD
jgi:hypothetical protein